MRSVCVIPARGGSKRIPRKNIKLFAGKPIIAHSIETAKESGLFDSIYVSTDDTEISKVALEYGASIISRPAAISDDFTGTHEVIKHAVQTLCEQNISFDSICCLYATAPFVKKMDLALGKEKLQEKRWKSVVAATDFSFPVFRSFRVLANGGVEMIFPEHYQTRSQDLSPTYHDAGQFYWMGKAECLGEPIGFGEYTTIVTIPHWRVQDIDSLDDWKRAEFIWRLLEDKDNEL